MMAGVLRWPRDTFVAYARGRATPHLYGQPYDEILERPVGEARAELGLNRPVTATASDGARLLALVPFAALAGAAIALTSFLSSPWWLRAGMHRNRRVREE